MRILPLLVLVVSLATAAHAQTGTLTPTPTLVVQNIPPIPASLVEDVRRYTEARLAILADWHPTRREMLIVTRLIRSAPFRLPADAAKAAAEAAAGKKKKKERK